MISASSLKLIRSLRQKKFRDQHQLYVVEGDKMMKELLTGATAGGHRITQLFATAEWIGRNRTQVDRLRTKVNEVTAPDLKRVSNLTTPQSVLALAEIPSLEMKPEDAENHTVLALEAIRDPGNLGTIIRTADWFGIRTIVCSPDSADVFNPKVVQSTMGAIFRTHVHYLDLEQFFSGPGMKDRIIYGTFIEGESIYGMRLDPHPVIIFGNESRGLSDRYDRFLNKKIAIPPFSGSLAGPESLNVASAVAVVCSELRRPR